jgi:hypothetical protein
MKIRNGTVHLASLWPESTVARQAVAHWPAQLGGLWPAHTVGARQSAPDARSPRAAWRGAHRLDGGSSTMRPS